MIYDVVAGLLLNALARIFSIWLSTILLAVSGNSECIVFMTNFIMACG